MAVESDERGRGPHELLEASHRHAVPIRESSLMRRAASAAVVDGLERHGPSVVGVALYGVIFLVFGTYAHFVLGFSFAGGAIAGTIVGLVRLWRDR